MTIVPVLKIGDGTMKKNDGDPAVHRHQEGLRDPEISNGMSLRDWFAGQAMIVMLRVPVPCGIPERIAQAAYGIAEAMLAEREKG